MFVQGEKSLCKGNNGEKCDMGRELGKQTGFLLLRNWKGKGACLLFLGRRERLRKKVPGTLVSL